jgi:type II secretory pathway pseudopilin PulG
MNIIAIIIGILLSLVSSNFSDAQSKSSDAVSKADINSIYQKLEEFYGDYGYYPGDNIEASLIPGLDPNALENGDGLDLTESFSTGPRTSEPTTSTEGYSYEASECKSSTPSPINQCKAYTLRVLLNDGTYFTKKSAN